MAFPVRMVMEQDFHFTKLIQHTEDLGELFPHIHTKLLVSG